MADSEFEYIWKNISRWSSVKSLAKERKDHMYLDEFRRDWRCIFAYGTYAHEGEVDPSFSMSETWNIIKNVTDNSTLSESDRPFRRRMINFMSGWYFLERLQWLTPDHIKHVHGMVMWKEKHKNGREMLVGKYRETPVFAGFKTFAPVSAIDRLVKDALHRYYKSVEDEDCDVILAAAHLFSDLINIHPFEDGNGRICRMILSHVLIQSGLSLFPVLLSSFHRWGRRHYVQAVKRFNENPSMLYTMIATSLVRVWDNFEQNVSLMEKSVMC